MRDTRRNGSRACVLLIASALLSICKITNGQCELGESVELQASDAAASDQFGNSVSIRADLAIVGAPKEDEAGTNYGAAYIYRRIGNGWLQEKKLVGLGVGPDGIFGASVAVDGSVAVVGAPQDTIAGGGMAFVFRKIGDDWELEATLAPSDLESFSDFGKSVSVHGDVAVVGAPPRGSVCCPSRHGAAYVYRFNGTQWELEQKLTSGDLTNTNESFGAAILLDGNYCIIGAPEDPPNYAGAAFVFAYDGVNWILEAELAAFDEQAEDRFGSSVSIDSEQQLAIVGAPYKDDVTNAGAVYIYHKDNGHWLHDAKLVPQVQNSNDNFGWSVSLQGSLAAIGAPGDSGFAGAAYVFRLVNNVWVETVKLKALGSEQFDVLGRAIALDSGNVIVGAEGFDGPGPDSGIVYLFGSFFDCNGNNDVDACEIADCIADPACQDCDFNLVPDSCDIAACSNEKSCADCNANLVPDGCETDCNSNAIPDECDLADCAGDPACDDCNNNLVPDGCDIATCDGQPECADSNANLIPDECESDCNFNGIPDAIDIASCNGDVWCGDCNENGVPDECDIASELSDDCNGNGTPDSCDIARTESRDCNADSIPDECALILAPGIDPASLAKCRALSLVPGNTGRRTALRVTLITLHHVDPPYSGGASIPFAAFEGQIRWVGAPRPYVESTSNPAVFLASELQCEPYFRDWGSIGLLHIVGSEVVPSSAYDIQTVLEGCDVLEEANYSQPTHLQTTRWGDVSDPYNPPSITVQPDLADISAMVDKFRSAPSALIKAQTVLAGSVPDFGTDLGFDDISACVDAFRGLAYPYTIIPCP